MVVRALVVRFVPLEGLWSYAGCLSVHRVQQLALWYPSANYSAAILQGTDLLLRGDGKHYYIKIGNRESMYAAVSVR